MLEIGCAACGSIQFHYQKDGPGTLKRMYIDRIFSDDVVSGGKLVCFKCNKTLGVEINYKKEDRLAYRLFVGSVVKKIIKAG